MSIRALVPLLVVGMMLVGCSGNTRPIPPVAHVDVPRFMGDWYVIAHIPSRPEREAFDAVESYALRPDGRIQTTFRYRKGSFTGTDQDHAPGRDGQGRHRRRDLGHAVHLADPGRVRDRAISMPTTQQTIVGRSKRDYVWLMARTPTISDADYQAAMTRIAALGYDLSQVRRVPQSGKAE